MHKTVFLLTEQRECNLIPTSFSHQNPWYMYLERFRWSLIWRFEIYNGTPQYIKQYNVATYLLRKINRCLACYWVSLWHSYHAATSLHKDHTRLLSGVHVLGLNIHHLLIGYSLTVIKHQK